MEASLYDPERGYYAARRGYAQDFYTAPELHPAFGSSLADALIRLWGQIHPEPSQLWVVEMGSGAGHLAKAILEAMERRRPEFVPRLRYVLVERSPRLLYESVVALSSYAQQILGYVSLQHLPTLEGIFLSNELLDAMPVNLLEKRDGEIFEVYVQQSPAAEFRLGPLSDPTLEPFARRASQNLQEGERCAVSLEMLDWMHSLHAKLKRGFVLTIDYGEERLSAWQGLPKSFYRHTVGTEEELLQQRGRRDLSAPVDFGLLMREGERLGWKTESFESLGAFLMQAGILNYLPKGNTLPVLRETLKLKTLFHPEGMGEALKVLVQSKNKEE